MCKAQGDKKQIHSMNTCVRFFARYSINFAERMNIKYRYLKDGLCLDSLAGQGLGWVCLLQAEAKIQRWECVMFIGG